MNNKTIKKWFSMLLLMLVAGVGSAVAQSLTIADFAIAAGETKDVAITLTPDEGQTIYGVQTDVTLSEGLTLTGATKVDVDLSLSWNEDNNRLILLSYGGKIIAAGEVITLSIKAADDFEGGTVTLKNSRVTTSNTGTEATVDNSVVTVTAEAAFDPSTAIVNAEFNPAADPIGWTQTVSGGFRDIGMYAIGGSQMVRFAAPTVDDTHLSTEFAAGFEARWNGNFAAYTQTVSELPAGAYTLTYDVQNVNNATSNLSYENRFKVTVGETVYTDESTEWMKGGSAWTTHTVKFTIDEASPVTFSLGYGTGSNNTHADYTPAIYVSHLNLTYSAFADADDYTALNAAIKAVEEQLGGLSLGFDIGEYAPYNLIEISSALAEAKAVDQTVNNSQADVQSLTETLTNATWTANAAEVNAIWDPSFSYSYSTSGNVKPIAWTGTSGHDNATDVRWMWDSASNAGLTATTSGKALFTKFGAFYGKQEGYTLPLNENEYYTLLFVYGGWSDCKKDGYVTVADPSETTITLIPSVDLPLDAVDGHQNTSSWKEYQAFFKTNDAGNYVLGLRKKDESKQSQYVYSDFSLMKTTVAEATAYYNGVLDEVDDSYDAEANGGSEKTAFKEAIDASIEGKTVAEIIQAAENLYTLRDAFVAAIANYDAYAAAKSLAEAANLEYALASKKTALDEAMAEDPTTAEDASAKTAALYTALRAYYESNALAEGVEKAQDYTENVVAANAATNTGWTNGIGTNNGQGYTDAAGVTAEKYLDGGWAQNAGVNIDMTREVSVPVGRYLLTATARGAVDLTAYNMSIGGQSIDFEHIGGSGGVFGNGWNDASVEFESYGSALTLEVKATSTASQQWISIDRFRLVRIGESEIGNLIAEANELAKDDEAVAVGKLRDAIAAYNDGGAVADLQAAVTQFKADNADQEKDETAKVATDGWKKFTGNDAAGVCATQFAPAITTYDGRTANLRENYESTVETTGQIIYQDITGLTNGKYKVGFYANAFFTSGRGFSSDMEDGAEDVAYVFANEKKEFIVAKIAESTTENNFRQFDVEVTDGTIKLGMGKEKAGTNWHTMQIYQLTWFTTAKVVYAADKQEMTDLIAEAQALAANEYKTEGKDDLNTAIEAAEDALASNKLNIAEFEAEIQALQDAINAFKTANYVEFNGTYYVQNVSSGKFMAAGHNYGTRGIVNTVGLDLVLETYSDKTVTFDSQVNNGGNSEFLGSNLYMDAVSFAWIIEQTGEDTYSISDGTRYIGVDAEDNLVMSDEATDWQFIDADELYTARLTALGDATADNGMDATFLLGNPNFNRNDQRVGSWSVSDDCTNSNLNGGNGENNCAESYCSAFTISQTVTGVPAGIYKMTAQGFYRQENGSTDPAPSFFGNNKTAEVPLLTGSENSMSAASESFANGQYTIEPLEFIVGSDGKLTVGAKNESASQWVIFDNFQLTYYGPAPTTTVTLAVTDAQYATFVAPFDVAIADIPEGVTAYTVDDVDENDVLQMTAVTTTIPANTPVVLYSENVVSTEVSGVADPAENLTYGILTGVYAETAVPNGSYVLQNHEGTVAFYVVDTEVAQPKVQANHAYMTISSGDGARAYYFGGATAISTLKALTDGDGEIYDLNGRRQTMLQKGVNIIRSKDGRTQKVMVK